MKLRPLHDRVVVRRVKEEEKTKGGIIIPDTAKEKPQEGEIVAVGSGARGDDNEIIPLEVVVRNVAAGSLCKRLGLEEGEPLPHSLIEYYYKDDALGDPLVAEEHIACFNWASQEEMQDMSAMAIRINDFIAGMFAAVDIRLVDFKLEFGRLWDGDYARVILADEISPDGCRLWDMNSGEKLDKDRFRRDLGGEEEAYQEVARRLGVLQNDGNTPGEVFDLSAHRGRKRGSTPKKK